MINKRDYPRINTNYSARYRNSMDNRVEEVELENISASGALFITEYKLKKGTNLNMKIELPQVGEIPLPATVVRSTRKKGSLRYEIAVEFRKEEKRQDPRLKVNYFAWYRKIEKEDSNGYNVVTLKDLSAGGASFLSDEELEVGGEIDLDLDLPGIGKTPIKAEVVRIDVKKRKFAFYEIGVKFTTEKIYKPSINYISDTVERQMSMVA